MKSKFISFGVLMLLLAGIMAFAVIYVYVMYLQSSIYESQAIIAQAQPDILIAEGHYAISQSVAFSQYVMASMVFVLGLAPYAFVAILALLAIAYFISNRAKKEIGNDDNL